MAFLLEVRPNGDVLGGAVSEVDTTGASEVVVEGEGLAERHRHLRGREGEKVQEIQ